MARTSKPQQKRAVSTAEVNSTSCGQRRLSEGGSPVKHKTAMQMVGMWTRLRPFCGWPYRAATLQTACLILREVPQQSEYHDVALSWSSTVPYRSARILQY